MFHFGEQLLTCVGAAEYTGHLLCMAHYAWILITILATRRRRSNQGEKILRKLLEYFFYYIPYNEEVFERQK